MIGEPEHPFADGVIVKVTSTGALLELVNVPEMSPVPEAAMPVIEAVLSRVQLYVVPVTKPLKAMVVIGVAEQMVWVVGVATAFGVGLTSTVAEIGVPEQPPADGVIVKVTVTGADVVLVSVQEMLPEPEAAMPVIDRNSIYCMRDRKSNSDVGIGVIDQHAGDISASITCHPRHI